MDDIRSTIERLILQLEDAVETDAIAALRVIGDVHRDVGELQRDAVRVAAGTASWARIGAALGVSKQAAHQRFAKEWADQLKGELKAEATKVKTASKRGDFVAAAQAQGRLESLVEEFRAARTANRRRRAS